METTLEKNRSGRWEIRWSEQIADGSWRSRTLSCRTKSRADAIAFRDAWVAGLKAEAAPGAVAPATPTIAEIVGQYRIHHVEANSLTATQDYSLRPVEALLGHLEPGQLTPKELLTYRKSRMVKDGTLRREFGALLAALNWAVRQKIIDRGMIPTIDLPPEGQAVQTYLDAEDEAKFHAYAMGASIGKKAPARITLFVGLALDTAARKKAIEGLTWDRVNLKTRMIDFRDPSLRATKKRRGMVPISDRLLPLLEWAERTRVDEFVLPGGGAIRSAYETWVATTPYPDITPHDLRRTWATLAAMAGVPLIEIADVLQDTIEVVMKHYRVFQPNHLRGAVNARWS